MGNIFQTPLYSLTILMKAYHGFLPEKRALHCTLFRTYCKLSDSSKKYCFGLNFQSSPLLTSTTIYYGHRNLIRCQQASTVSALTRNWNSRKCTYILDPHPSPPLSELQQQQPSRVPVRAPAVALLPPLGGRLRRGVGRAQGDAPVAGLQGAVEGKDATWEKADGKKKKIVPIYSDVKQIQQMTGRLYDYSTTLR